MLTTVPAARSAGAVKANEPSPAPAVKAVPFQARSVKRMIVPEPTAVLMRNWRLSIVALPGSPPEEKPVL